MHTTDPDASAALAQALAERRADPAMTMPAEPTLAELHADDILRGAIRVNDQRMQGAYCVLLPDEEIPQRWVTVEAFKSKPQAEAFAAGYVLRRDRETDPKPLHNHPRATGRRLLAR